jgi:RNA polymerase sigma-70 factor, ECF subfamily
MIYEVIAPETPEDPSRHSGNLPRLAYTFPLMPELVPGGETVPLDWASEPDEPLMLRVQGGDTRALELLIQRWSPRLAGLFYRLTGDPHAGDDLLQETFLRVWAARESFRRDARFSPWVHAIARNLATDRAKSRSRKPFHRALNATGAPGSTTTMLGKIPDNATTPFAAASRLELLAKLDEALRGVPEPYREAVVLCDLQRLSYDDAAQVIGVPAKTVSSRLARGREHLRNALSAFRSGPLP